MDKKIVSQNLIDLLEPKKNADHAWFLDLIDAEKQNLYETAHIDAVMKALRVVRIREHKKAIDTARAEIDRIEKEQTNVGDFCFFVN